jgi:phosphatidyl-myo-inositol dimannoside synthase
MKQKRTLIITLEYPPQIGGIATFTHQLANSFDPAETVMLAPKMKGDVEWDDVNVNYRIIREKLYYPKFIWPRWLRLYFVVRKIVKEYGIELIMVHHVLPVGYVAYLMKKFLNVPYIIFSHGTDVVAATRTSWKKKMAMMVVEKSEQVIFNSNNLKQRLLRVLPQFENISTVMYPCPDEDFFTPADPKAVQKLRDELALEGKQVILSIGRIDDGKGFTHMVRILPKILEQVPHLVWVIIGEGPKRTEMYNEIRKNNLQNVVRYVGMIPHEQIKKFYYLADVFALFTHPDNGKEEGLGLVFLEASACGLPVVAGKSGGVVEAVLHAQTGLVMDIYQNLPAAGDAITQILQNKSFGDKLGTAGQDRIKSTFIWKHQTKVLERWMMLEQ